MNEHSDHDLPSAEADRLELLLRRAAERVPVGPAPSRSVAPSPPTRSVHRRLLAVAAAVLLVAAIGGTWWLVTDDGQRVDAGPADPPEVTELTVAPRVLEQTGVWRLPEGLDDLRVVGAQETGLSTGWAETRPGLLVVDEIERPARWLLVESYQQFGVPPTDAREHQLSPAVEAFTVTSTADGGPIWFEVDPTDDAFEESLISGAVQGVDEADLIDALRATYAEPAGYSLDWFATSADRLAERLDLDGGERFAWTGEETNDDPGAYGVPAIELTLMTDSASEDSNDGADGPEIVVMLAGTDGAPAWAQQLRFEQQADISSIALDDVGPGVVYRATPRPELGRNVLEVSSSSAGMPTVTSLLVFSDDGVMISVARAAAVDQLRGTGRDPLPEAEQLRIVNSLRAMSESDFTEQLAALGVEFITADGSSPGGVGPTTTLPGG